MQIGLNLALTLEHGGAGAPTLDMTFTGTGNALDSRITFTRASGATWFNSAGILQGVDFSVTSNTIGTGSKTFTLTATGGVNRYWTAGDTVLISDQANSANNMVGTVTSYNASTQVLVCNITSTGGSGTLTAWRIGSTMPRFDYNPSTLAAQGFLVEEARTNSIRNNTMQGAVAGTPGTLPTNWVVVAGGLGTLTQQVVGTGTSAGITYIDIRLSGTTSTTSVGYSFESTTQIVAAQNQVWASTFWAALQAGSLTNINTVENRIVERDAGGTSIGSTITDFKASFTSVLTRTTTTRTLANASAGRVTNDVTISFSSGVAIDITLRIGLPQLEQGAFATSVIPTTTTALTRSADVASVNTLSPWYNQTEGTVYAELQSLSPLTAAQSVALNKYPNVWCIDAGTSDSSVIWYGVGAEMFISGTYNNIGTVPSGVNKFAVALAASGNQSSSSLNGAAAVNRSGSLSVTATQFNLGRDPGGTQVLNGYLRRIVYYPRRLSNVELQAITA